MKVVGQKGSFVLVRLNRSKYEPHQGNRERTRRLRQMINGQLPRPRGVFPIDLQNTLLEIIKHG